MVIFNFLITYPIHVLKSSENRNSIVLSNEILSLSHNQYEYLNKKQNTILILSIDNRHNQRHTV